MIWRVEIKQKSGLLDAGGQAVLKDIVDLGVSSIQDVRVVGVYLLEGQLSREDVKRVCQELLVDPIVEEYGFSSSPKKESQAHSIIEIAYNPGVMDPVEASTLKGIRDLGIAQIQAVRTAKQYHFWGALSKKDIEHITHRLLMNKLIQHAVESAAQAIPTTLTLGAASKAQFDVLIVELLKASHKDLMQISKKGQLYLSLNEMKTIQAHFKKEGRNPTDVELETFAQTWSEHCHHKTFRGIIRYREGQKGRPKIIRSLFKSTIAKVTRDLNKKWCVSVFHDNAGVIAFDKDYHVCFKVETHNHPSALEPFGGANTGVGGVIRDILGTGLAAKPLANTDVFCFAPPDTPARDIPAGALHPKRVMKGVVSGVRDYGNKMGIPTVNGAIVFDKHFVGNPLVFCGNVGLIPRGKEIKQVNKGDLIVAIGGRTGRDGIHGATFSSGELTSQSEMVSSGAVQIGNPIEEKKLLDALMKARERHLYSSITDCGAGGFSSAVGEMGAQTGARVDLDKAPLKYQGLRYTEVWISESQERMIMSVPPAHSDELLKIFDDENVEACVLGEFDGSGRLQLFFHGHQVCDLDMRFLHDGIPLITKDAVYQPPKLKAEKLADKENLTDDLCAALSHFNVASKESVIRVYDHEVQGTSVVKPLVGIHTDGPSDAAVIAPRLGFNKGLAISNGINVRLGMIDPFWMAASCIDEAIRQIIAVGGSLERMALLDNFCWGNPDKEDRLGTLVRCAQGCYKAAKAFGTPFISGKDSLYNEYTHQGRSLAIPGTILISAMGILEDISKAVTMDLKKTGNSIYVVGTTFDELGGSIYLANEGQLGQNVPRVRFPTAIKTYQAIEKVVEKGLIASMHDVSEGGLAVALAEMAFAGGRGITGFVKAVPYQGKSRHRRDREDVILFSESNSRLLVEVESRHEKAFKQMLKGIVHAKIASVEASSEMMVYGLKDQVVINANIFDLKQVWKNPLF
ncbi:MAG: phosphoribosylformylglycinamidine synthase subunit PurL [Candidatus Omnitrophica bacterium]|nr:phosphoribosylformylglycinamidine synthase subunit PurL [Candidatus Omnitrophota bacterium]